MGQSNTPKTVYWLDNNVYLNITNKCSNNCWFCFRNFKQGVGGFNLKLQEEPSAATVMAELQEALASRSWSEVVFCGFGEPTERLDLLLEIARWIKAHYPRILIRLDTNGHGFAINKGREVAEELKAAGISKVSVSMNGHNAETYNENCKPTFSGAFETVLDFVKKAMQVGLEVEVSAVRMPEVNMEKVGAVAESLGVSLKIRDYIPCFW